MGAWNGEQSSGHAGVTSLLLTLGELLAVGVAQGQADKSMQIVTVREQQQKKWLIFLCAEELLELEWLLKRGCYLLSVQIFLAITSVETKKWWLVSAKSKCLGNCAHMLSRTLFIKKKNVFYICFIWSFFNAAQEP